MMTSQVGRDERRADGPLVDGLRAGTPAAVETLIQRYAGGVRRAVGNITHNDADGDEVVQDVFMTVLRKIDGFEARAALRSWIHRIAVNAALNKRRGTRRPVEIAVDQRRSESPTPEEEVLARERRAVLARALDELPEHYRDVIVLCGVEELSNEEIAERVGESVAAVKSRLHRARRLLRARLAPSTA